MISEDEIKALCERYGHTYGDQLVEEYFEEGDEKVLLQRYILNRIKGTVRQIFPLPDDGASADLRTH